MAGRAVRRLGERLALVLLGLVVAAALLEAGLGIGASFISFRRAAYAHGTETVTILCLGDSHTYGLSCPAEEAYPGRLQADLDRRAPGRYRVVNLGLPGMNSSQVAARLPAWLDHYRPGAIVVNVGTNNFWNLSEQQAGPVARWLAGTRLYRFYTLEAADLQEMRASPPPVARPEVRRVLQDGGRGGQELSDAKTGELLIKNEGNISEALPVAEATAQLRHDLETIQALTHHTAGVRLVLLTYSAFPLPGRAGTLMERGAPSG